MNLNLFKLTKAKLFLLLVLSIVSALGIIFLFQNSSSRNTYQSTLSETLNAQRQQILTEIQNKLTTQRLDESKLCQKLKEENPTFIDLNSYLQTANSIEQLNKLHEEIQKVISSLTQPPSPTNKWEKVLWEVKKFLDTNPSSDKIKKWGERKKSEIEDPLLGIDLKGANRSTLLGLNRGSGEREIAKKAKGKAEIWKNHYISLFAAGDGNCFLNSFAILLTGSQVQGSKDTPGTQQNVATRLRTALCLETMINFDSSSADEFENLKDFSTNNLALTTDQSRYMTRILKRQVTTVHKDSEAYAPGKSPDTGGIIASKYDDGKQGKTFLYEEPFVIYHVGSYHFEPLVCKKQGGTISFNYSQWEVEDENNGTNQRSIVFTLNPGTLKSKPYSSSANALPQKKVRVLYNQNNNYAKNQFEGVKLENTENNGTKKTNRDITIDIIKINEISTLGGEIDINYDNYHTVTLIS